MLYFVNQMIKGDVNILTTKKLYLKWSFRPTFKRENQFRKGARAIGKKSRISLSESMVYKKKHIRFK